MSSQTNPWHRDVITKQSHTCVQILNKYHHPFLYKSYEVLFPFKPYAIQQSFIRTVIDALQNGSNALLQSPTGTGKTLCLLTAALAWLQKNKQNVKPSHKIIYLSRTHNQIRQVIKELKRTSYLPRIVTASSRDNACVNADLISLRGHHLEVQCRKRIIKTDVKGQSDKSCSYYENVKKNVHYSNKNRPVILDLQELKDAGTCQNFCPFFYNREQDLRNNADIIFMPYNYLLDRNINGIYSADIQNAIVIFDEAHNVQNVSCQGNSMVLTVKMIELAIKQLSEVQNYLDSIPQQYASTMKINASELDELGKNFYRIVVEMNKVCQDCCQNQREDYVMTSSEIIKFFKAALLDELQSDLGKSIRELIQIGMNVFEEAQKIYTWNIDKTMGFISLFYQLYQSEAQNKNSWLNNKLNCYRLHFRQEAQDLAVQLMCLDPSLLFQILKSHKPYNIVLTSGTLAPLQSWQSQLRIPFPEKLTNNHVISQDQILASIVECGPKGHKFCFTYQNRDFQEMDVQLGTAILELVKLIPNGVLLIFPSYAIMEKMKKTWRNKHILQEIHNIKVIYYEPKQQKDLTGILEGFNNAAKTKRGALLMGVCRGKIAEGIDFNDELCRAVIFVGLPYPPTRDKKIENKRVYLNSVCAQINRLKSKENRIPSLNGNAWYSLQMIRSLNQAIGRVIRNIDDFGAIYLFDERFNNKQVQKQLPNWVKSSLNKHENFQSVAKETKRFFADNIKKYKQKNPLNVEQKSNMQIPVKLVHITQKQSLKSEVEKKKLNLSGNNYVKHKALTLDQYFSRKS